jgi:uncharacterized glyoxalase superfamily protein PhnB
MTTNLMVESVDASVAFYRDILGFSIVASVPGKKDALQFAILAKDNLTLMLQERTSLAEEYPTLATARVRPSATLYINTDDLNGLYQELKAKHAILCDMHTSFYGAKEFAIADTDGYVLTFAEQAGA